MPTTKDINDKKAEAVVLAQAVQSELAQLETQLDESELVSSSLAESKSVLVDHIKESMNALAARVGQAFDAAISREAIIAGNLQKEIAARDGSDDLPMTGHNSKKATGKGKVA